MSLNIDPNQQEESNGGGAPSYATAGRKLLWASGIKWGQSQAGNTKVEVRFAVVDGDEINCQVWDTFTLTQRAAWKIGQFAKAAKQTSAFDAEDREAMDEVLARRPVYADIEMEEKPSGGTRPRIIRYAAYDGDISETMDEAAQRMEEYHAKGQQMQGNKSSDDIPF